MLTAAQLQQRDGKLTASRVACLMTGDPDKITNLWRELVGDPAFVPENLSDIWPVRLGEATEAINLEWFGRKVGKVSRQGEVMTHTNGWAAATLDGWSDDHTCPIECKHVGGREPLETIVERYQPQMQWQMIVTGAERCALSVIMGADEPAVEFIDRAADYAAELWRRAEAFMECVRTLTPPVVMPPAAAPVIPVKIADMAASNAWCANAVTWMTTRQAAADNRTAERELKALVPEDAKKAHGAGVVINRDRAGRLSLREERT